MHEEIIHINNGEVTNYKALEKFYAGLGTGKYLITAKNIKKRSNNQNRYYWSVCVGMIKDRMIELGNDVDAQLVHDYLKDRFNRKEIWADGVNIGSIGDTTTKLNKEDFEKYLEKVKRFAADVLSIYIPDPNQPSVLFAEHDHEIGATIVTRA